MMTNAFNPDFIIRSRLITKTLQLFYVITLLYHRRMMEQEKKETAAAYTQ